MPIVSPGPPSTTAMTAAKPTLLRAATDPRWLQAVLADFDAFLADHANNERKASTQAMSFVVKFPDRTRILPALIRVAQEELEHFRQVYALMERRRVPLAPDVKDPYVNALRRHLRHGRDERFLDQLALAAVVEARGAERLGLLADALEGGGGPGPVGSGLPGSGLAAFYRELTDSEHRHRDLYASMARRYFDDRDVDARLASLAEREAEVLAATPIGPRLH